MLITCYVLAQVLIIHGEGDALVPLSNSRRLAALLPGARLEVFSQCGHVPQEELPDKFVNSVADFVNGVRAARS
jgi:pimeloyl-ACP methyl ester carboxylesterase